jgi:hypothetical protein
MSATFFSPKQAADIAWQARKLLRLGLLTHHAWVVLDAILFGARPKGQDTAIVSYTEIQRLAHVSRQTASDAVADLARLGLLKITKRRILVLWNNGGRAWRQLKNAYVFSAIRCESTGRTEKTQLRILYLNDAPIESQRAAQAALDARRRAMEDRLRTNRRP